MPKVISSSPGQRNRNSTFAHYLQLWDLTLDGDPIVTRGARLLPVRRRGAPAMLKVATEAEEGFGGALMAWWEGHGAARVLEMAGDAILLERAQGEGSLAAFARDGRDDETTRILCDAVAVVHAPRSRPLPEL
ncbi:MAG: aminoglycoside phosphotransferase family protein, partial [Acidimicrobiales bacterium]